MSRLMNARYKDTGSASFSLVLISLPPPLPPLGKKVYKTRIFTTMCNNCRMRGKDSCNHSVEMPWSSQAQSAKIEAIMADQSEIYRREILNEETEATIVKAFNPEDVDQLASTNFQLKPTDDIRFVFVGIDPAAGGSGSKFAIVSLVAVERQVTGADPSQTEEDVVVCLLSPPPPPISSGLSFFIWIYRHRK